MSFTPGTHPFTPTTTGHSTCYIVHTQHTFIHTNSTSHPISVLHSTACVYVIHIQYTPFHKQQFTHNVSALHATSICKFHTKTHTIHTEKFICTQQGPSYLLRGQSGLFARENIVEGTVVASFGAERALRKGEVGTPGRI